MTWRTPGITDLEPRNHASLRCWAAVQAGRWADARMWAGVWARVMRSITAEVEA